VRRVYSYSCRSTKERFFQRPGNHAGEPAGALRLFYFPLRFQHIMQFQQAPPALGNQYEDDSVLRSHLMRSVPADVLREIKPTLVEMGELGSVATRKRFGPAANG
jgi:hypothetical protein